MRRFSFPPHFFYALRLRLSPGLGTFCPPTADGGAKADFKVQRLTPGSGAVLPGKPGVGAKLYFKAFINLLRFKIHFASKLAFKNRFGFKTCNF